MQVRERDRERERECLSLWGRTEEESVPENTKLKKKIKIKK